MAMQYSSITDEQLELIENSPVFFVATADPQLKGGPDDLGAVNLSPKGGTPLHVIDRNRLAFLDYPGSGNETARHALAGGPVTVMVCSFQEDDAAIVRLYGRATASDLETSPLASRLLENAAAELSSKPRQVIEVEVEKTQVLAPFVAFLVARRFKGPSYRTKTQKAADLT